MEFITIIVVIAFFVIAPIAIQKYVIQQQADRLFSELAEVMDVKVVDGPKGKILVSARGRFEEMELELSQSKPVRGASEAHPFTIRLTPPGGFAGLRINDTNDLTFWPISGEWMVDENVRCEAPDPLIVARCLSDTSLLSRLERLVSHYDLALRVRGSTLRAHHVGTMLTSSGVQKRVGVVADVARRLSEVATDSQRTGGGRFAAVAEGLGLSTVGRGTVCLAARGVLDGREAEVVIGRYATDATPRVRFQVTLDVESIYREGRFSAANPKGTELWKAEQMSRQDILAGDDQVDPEWILQGDDDLIRGIFSRDGMSDALQTLHRSGCYVFFSTEKVVVVRARVPEKSADFEEFVTSSSRLAGLLEDALRVLT